MNQRDEAEGRNTERERLISTEIDRKIQTLKDAILLGRPSLVVPELRHFMMRLAFSADAGNDATIERLRYQLRAEHDAYADLGRQIEARDAELAELRKDAERYRWLRRWPAVRRVLFGGMTDFDEVVDERMADMATPSDAAITAAANPVDEGEDK